MTQQQDPAIAERERGTRAGGARDDLEGGTTRAASMTGGAAGDSPAENASAPEASPAGRASPAGVDQGSIGMSSATGGPVGAGGGDAPAGPGGQGSLGSSTYNERGNVTGPESPAGLGSADGAPSEGQGDDLTNRLGGGGDARTGLTGAGAASGDMSAGRSETASAGGANAPDAGSPGGMGGVHAQGVTGAGRPPGGVSPVEPRSEGGE